MIPNPYVVRFSVLFSDGSGSTSEMQFRSYTAQDALTQFEVYIKSECSHPERIRVRRIDPGVLRCPTCKTELSDDISGARNLMFCNKCRVTWGIPMEIAK